MGHLGKVVALVGMCLSLASFSIEPRFSVAALAALDPSRIAQTLCGARRADSALASELLIASAVAAPISDASPIPLYGDLTNSRFPLTTANAQARRYFSQGLFLPMASTTQAPSDPSAKDNGWTLVAQCAGGAKPLRSVPISMHRWMSATVGPRSMQWIGQWRCATGPRRWSGR